MHALDGFGLGDDRDPNRADAHAVERSVPVGPLFEGTVKRVEVDLEEVPGDGQAGRPVQVVPGLQRVQCFCHGEPPALGIVTAAYPFRVRLSGA